MPTLAERLFSIKAGEPLLATSLDESGEHVLLLIREAAIAVMDNNGDTPHYIQECGQGHLVSGSHTALLIAPNGAISKRTIQECGENNMHDPQDILNELEDLTEAPGMDVRGRRKKKFPTGTGPVAGTPPADPLALLGQSLRNESQIDEQLAAPPGKRWVHKNPPPGGGETEHKLVPIDGPVPDGWLEGHALFGDNESIQEYMDEARRDYAGQAMGFAGLGIKTAKRVASQVSGTKEEQGATPRIAAILLGSAALRNLADSGNNDIIKDALSGPKSNDSNLDMGHVMKVAAQHNLASPADISKYQALRGMMGESVDEANYTKGTRHGYGRLAQPAGQYGKSKSRGYNQTDPRPEDEQLQVRESDALQFWLDDVVEAYFTPDMVPHIRDIDRAVEEDDFEAFDIAVQNLAEIAGEEVLNEYKRMSGGQKAKAARSRKKPKTGKQKAALKKRRKAYKKGGKRRAAKYRQKNKSRLRSSEDYTDNLMEQGGSDPVKKPLIWRNISAHEQAGGEIGEDGKWHRVTMPVPGQVKEGEMAEAKRVKRVPTFKGFKQFIAAVAVPVQQESLDEQFFVGGGVSGGGGTPGGVIPPDASDVPDGATDVEISDAPPPSGGELNTYFEAGWQGDNFSVTLEKLEGDRNLNVYADYKFGDGDSGLIAGVAIDDLHGGTTMTAGWGISF